MIDAEKPFYDACLFTTMLRIFTSHHRLQGGPLAPVAARTGLAFLGLLLRRLVDTVALGTPDCKDVTL